MVLDAPLSNNFPKVNRHTVRRWTPWSADGMPEPFVPMPRPRCTTAIRLMARPVDL